MMSKMKILELRLCGCGDEGDILIEKNKNMFLVYYQAPDNFIINYLELKNVEPNKLYYNKLKITKELDLYLVYGNCIEVHEQVKSINYRDGINSVTAKGEVIAVISDELILVDVGEMDLLQVINESDTSYIKKGIFIEVSGTYQTYFSGTEYCYE